ncbi:hypothetical protein [Paenibacillus oleatilyticus]|uniref:hypothetical protein n=1 Tax=Paenibacillus oleatilyticus TaxID=2594886 RepID=UPI0020A731C1|nr:hypothetical protein [Paenibacillus oleatilyticus]
MIDTPCDEITSKILAATPEVLYLVRRLAVSKVGLDAVDDGERFVEVDQRRRE